MPRATAILVVDALRFGLGMQLALDVNRQEGAERATVLPARAPLPSITPLGMGLALPLPEEELLAEVVDGKWQLYYLPGTTNLTTAAQRRAWWQQHGHVAPAGLLSLDSIQTGEIPSPSPQLSRLVITDDAIDRMGHDDELEALGSRIPLERYLAAIARLRDAGWLRILVVTDHGYIHWSGSEERGVAPGRGLPGQYAGASTPVVGAGRALARGVAVGRCEF